MAESLILRDVATGAMRPMDPQRLLIAGFTGRDEAAVEAHIEELRELGAPVPETTPVLMQLDPALLTTAEAITVAGEFTSGEVEPVVAVTQGTRLLLVGSDHTDRDLERESISRSKAVCPKVVSDLCVAVDAIEDWDAIELRSWADGAPDMYQSGSLADILPLEEIIRHLDEEGIQLADGDVLFLGTVPVVGGGLRAAGRFRGELRLPGHDRVLAVDYRVTVAA